MKNTIILLFIVIIVPSISCERKVESLHYDPNCNNLISGIINTDNTIVNSEIEKLTNDLSPRPTDEDPLGHSGNFEILISRLTGCSKIVAELTCYGCIKTMPPLSEILIKADSSGTIIRRYIDFEANELSDLKPLGIHN